MPTYEYDCPKCQKTFDVFQSITAKPLKTCPTCKGKVKRRIGTGAGIIFKGSGFYQTDYRSDSYRKKAREESGASTSQPADSKTTTTKAKSSSAAATA